MYRRALEIDERLGRLEGMATTYRNLGNMLRTRGDLVRAEQMYRKALETAEQLGSLSRITQIKSLLDSLREQR